MPMELEGEPIEIKLDTVAGARHKLKNRKESAPRGIKAEMVKGH